MPDEGNLREHVLVNGPFSYSWPPTSGNAWSRALLCQVLPMPEAEYRISPDLYLAALSPLFGPLGRVSHSLSAWRSHGANSSYSDPFDRRLLANVARERHCLDTLSAYCRQFGLAHDRSMWVQESWWHRIERACTSIVAAVPDEGAFVLIDEDQWGARPLISGRRVVPFTERQGEYWGPPSDSASAIAEAERHRLDGCEHVCVAWSSRWILEHYADFGTHLFDTARSVHTSNDCTIFDCRR